MTRVIECPHCHGHKFVSQPDGYAENCELCGGYGEITDKTPDPRIRSLWATTYEELLKLMRPLTSQQWTTVDLWTIRGEWWALMQPPIIEDPSE